MKLKSYNKMIHGTIGGLLLPVITFLIILLVKKDASSFSEYFRILFEFGILPKIISLCLLPNLLLFFIFIWTERNRAAQGVILSMFIVGGIILILKIV